MKKKKKESMEELLSKYRVTPLNISDTVEGEVISITKNEIWLDILNYGAGVIYRRELRETPGDLEIKIGDKIKASVIEPESEEGYTILSVGKVAKERGWDRLKELKETKEPITIRAFEANKGGLLIEVDGIRGFLPVSQLATEHYPRVSGGDKDEILSRLSQLINKPLSVVILDADRKENKLIFSEKEAQKENTLSKISQYKVGEKIKGKVTGVADFGVFININGVEGMIHISEISWDKVDSPKKYVKVGDEIEAIIIGIEEDRLSLSLKRLVPDPWLSASKNIEVGQIVEGEITKLTPFGAFVKIDKNIEGLLHISEITEKKIKNPLEEIQLGKSYKFKIISLEPELHKLALSLKRATKKNKKEESKTVKKAKKTKKKKNVEPRE